MRYTAGFKECRIICGVQQDLSGEEDLSGEMELSGEEDLSVQEDLSGEEDLRCAGGFEW